MYYGYIRVSTENQTVENQKIAIRSYCKQQHKRINIWISETVSGAKDYKKRNLGKLLESCERGDTIICTEISRLGRSITMIFEILQKLMDKGIKVITIKDGWTLGDDLQSKVLAFAFGISAEIERKLISERTKQGLERARREGKKIGRQPGVSPKKYKLSGKLNYIKKELKSGRSKRSLAIELKVAWKTLDNFIQLNKIHVCA